MPQGLPGRLPILLIALPAAFPAAGCSREKEAPPVASATEASPAATAGPPAAPVATAPAQARTVKVDNADYAFEYAYPVAAAVIPDLRRFLDADLARQRADLMADAKAQQADAKKSGYPYRALGYWADWKVVTDLPGWLSLSGSVSTYEGGAHPNHAFDTILWDKQRNLRRDPFDLFTSKAALSGVIRKDFCRLLDREREKRRGEKIAPGSQDEFDQCIDPADNTVILGSASGKAFDRIGVLVAPYNAGPYAEGEYEVTLPVSAEVMAVVKPEYRSSFASGR